MIFHEYNEGKIDDNNNADLLIPQQMEWQVIQVQKDGSDLPKVASVLKEWG